MNPALSIVLYVLLFLLYLVVEVFMAMATYMYLNIYTPQTFGSLIGFARALLNSSTTYLERLSPDLANRAYTTLLGDLGPKSVLLLLIGLLVSALARLSHLGDPARAVALKRSATDPFGPEAHAS